MGPDGVRCAVALPGVGSRVEERVHGLGAFEVGDPQALAGPYDVGPGLARAEDDFEAGAGHSVTSRSWAT